ncbi:PREDICTED: uncharacterized protein LOC107183314 [Myotis davidii]|uniref:uncharacterized protein LOC107183314 n=1 Tax=Myotis davidii TaxID=225400 RepID=UPI000766F1BE|nr:PREDICTED: uncharacterized protein LOC107183314 [Myotis davidii]
MGVPVDPLTRVPALCRPSPPKAGLRWLSSRASQGFGRSVLPSAAFHGAPQALWGQNAAFAPVPGECRRFQEKFMKCLRDNKFENALCRHESKEYLECRMERQLMAQEPLEKLGFGDLMDGKADRH